MKLGRALAVGAVVSGAPSTLWALASGHDPLGATRAAGRLLAPDEARTWRLLACAGVAHAALTLAWGAVLTVALPRRRRVLAGAVAGLGIAGVDLGLAHLSAAPRFAAVRALPVGPQLADHAAFGATVALLTA